MRIDSKAVIAYKDTIERALNYVKRISEQHNRMKTLITESLYLIDDALSLL